MARRRLNPNLIKLHRTYDVSELARHCQVHKNTILHWRTDGLEPIDGAKPMLFHGSAVREFLSKKNLRRKQPCGPGRLFCFRCRRPQPPALGLVEYVPMSAKSGNVRAFCEGCETVMHRRVTLASLAVTMPDLEIQFPEGDPRLIGSRSPSLNRESESQAQE